MDIMKFFRGSMFAIIIIMSVIYNIFMLHAGFLQALMIIGLGIAFYAVANFFSKD